MFLLPSLQGSGKLTNNRGSVEGGGPTWHCSPISLCYDYLPETESVNILPLGERGVILGGHSLTAILLLLSHLISCSIFFLSFVCCLFTLLGVEALPLPGKHPTTERYATRDEFRATESSLPRNEYRT